MFEGGNFICAVGSTRRLQAGNLCWRVNVEPGRKESWEVALRREFYNDIQGLSACAFHCFCVLDMVYV